MSLVAFAIRVAAVRALRAALPAAFTVLDSPLDVVATLETNPASGLVAVFTGYRENKFEGMAFSAGAPKLSVELQIFLPRQLAFTYLALDGETEVSLAIDTRGGGGETALDIVERMIARALELESEIWSQLLAQFLSGTREVITSSYLVETSKVKAAAREIRLNCETLQEPIPGAAPYPVWASLFTAMQGDTATIDNVAGLAPWIAAELGLPAGQSQAQLDQSFLGMSDDDFQAIGLGPDSPDDYAENSAGVTGTADVIETFSTSATPPANP